MRGADDPEELTAALTWVRDASIGVGSEAVKAAVRACVPTQLTSTLVEALVAPGYTLRHQAIYTLGKMTFRDDVGFLLAVFDRYLDQDPLLVPNLFGEITWLGGGGAAILARIRTHSSYLTRWSFFGTDAAQVELTRAGELRAACAELAGDRAVVVQAEARHVLTELKILAEAAGAPQDRASRRERKRRLVEHAKAAPLRFVPMGLRFLNQHHGLDYDVEALDTFVRSLSVAS